MRRILTAHRPDGSALTLPLSSRGARERLNTWPSRRPTICASGADVSGAAGSGAASLTMIVSTAVGALPAFVALTGIAPFSASVRVARPAASVTAKADPAVTVAPETGVRSPSPGRPCVSPGSTTVTVTVLPRCAALGTPSSLSGTGEGRKFGAGPETTASMSTSSPGFSVSAQTPLPTL